jgi:hypothetical protein
MQTASETNWKIHAKHAVVRLFNALGLDVRRIRSSTPFRAPPWPADSPNSPVSALSATL